MDTNELWDELECCCGCGACAAKCPRSAISMVESPEGFVYPRIDNSLCVDCGLCRKACGFQKLSAQESLGPWYAASYRGDFSQSTSAGAFYGLAVSVLSLGGVVFGAAYSRDGKGLHVRHVMAKDVRELRALQGSKYVQSDAGSSFSEVERQLNSGRTVLFSGTPCQIAGLRGYLGRDWPNLITVDLICHGVPSEAMFRALVDTLESRYGMQVADFCFRCKREGWGHSLLLLRLCKLCADGSADDNELVVSAQDFPYYDLFLNLKTLRNSCYSCPFAGPVRPGDFTVGDFWGVSENCPPVIEDGRFDASKGISCLLVNTERGRLVAEKLCGTLDLLEVSFADIAKGNEQLRHPSELPVDRSAYLLAFRDGGWSAVEGLWYRRERGLKYRVKQIAKHLVPDKALQFAKRLLCHY